MRSFFRIHCSSRHKTACLALYRALLTRCGRLPVDDATRSLAVEQIRRRFRRDKVSSSHRLAVNALKTGYEALDLCDAAVQGDSTALERVQTLLQELPHPSTIALPPSKKERRKAKATTELAEPVQKYSILTELPQPLKKPPYLIIVDGFPFLRYKKPQPLSLSHALTWMQERRQKIIDRQWMRLDEMYLADLEDHWDFLLERSSGIADLPADLKKDTGVIGHDFLWTEMLEQEEIAAKDVLWKDRDKRYKMAEVRAAIVKREKERFANASQKKETFK